MKQAEQLNEIDRIDVRLAEIHAEGYDGRKHGLEWIQLCKRRWRAYDAIPGGWGYDVSTETIREHFGITD